jgi:nucleoside-diphosphate-sugar epimerase
MMGKRVLILGGSGFLGSYLRQELAADFEVETTSSSGSTTTHAFDISRSEHHASVVLGGGYDVVVNCIVRYGDTLAELFEINVRRFAELALALRQTSCHFVQASTFSATPENRHLTDYGLTKFLADEFLLQCVRGAPVRAAILRFGQIFDLAGRSARSQPGLYRWISQIRRNEPIDVFAGSIARRSYLPVELATKAIRLCIERELEGVHDVVAREAYTPSELAALLVQSAPHYRGDVRVSKTAQAFAYRIPDCSPAYAPWFLDQESCAETFRKFFQDD